MLSLDLFKVAEVELVYKNSAKASQRPQITSSENAYELLLQSWDENKIEFVEQAKVILLNRGNRVLGICEVSTGGLTGTVVDPRIIFTAALKANATSIMLAHNHPSSNLKPSDADIRLTEKIREAGKFLEIPLVDHIILSKEGYYSLMDNGYI